MPKPVWNILDNVNSLQMDKFEETELSSMKPKQALSLLLYRSLSRCLAAGTSIKIKNFKSESNHTSSFYLRKVSSTVHSRNTESKQCCAQQEKHLMSDIIIAFQYPIKTITRNKNLIPQQCFTTSSHQHTLKSWRSCLYGT